MTQGVNLREFEQFQSRVFRTALVLWTAALVISLIAYRAYSPLTGGVVIGGAASLAAFRYRTWTLRRLADQPTQARANRLPVVGAGRYLILAAALGLAAWLSMIDDVGYLIGAAGGLFLTNLAIIVQAARESRTG